MNVCPCGAFYRVNASRINKKGDRVRYLICTGCKAKSRYIGDGWPDRRVGRGSKPRKPGGGIVQVEPGTTAIHQAKMIITGAARSCAELSNDVRYALGTMVDRINADLAGTPKECPLPRDVAHLASVAKILSVIDPAAAHDPVATYASLRVKFLEDHGAAGLEQLDSTIDEAALARRVAEVESAT